MNDEELEDLCTRLAQGDAFGDIWDIRDRVNTSGDGTSNDILDHYGLLRFGPIPRNAATTDERYISLEQSERLLAAGGILRGAMREPAGDEPPPRFLGDVAVHADVLAAVDLICRPVEALRGQAFAIEVLADFESLPQAQSTASHRASEAAYIPSRDVIVINQATFNQRSFEFQRTVVLHEMAHAIRHRRGIAVAVGDCPPADAEVVRWGVGDEEYIATRERYYGPQYGALLRSIPDGADVEEALEAWAFQVRAGMIVLPKRQ